MKALTAAVRGAASIAINTRHSVGGYSRMRWVRPLLVPALAMLFACISANAQQNQPPGRAQDFLTAGATAHAACKALQEDHALDPLRGKIPFSDEKTTFAMLTNRARLLPKERPIIDLARKTLEKCS